MGGQKPGNRWTARRSWRGPRLSDGKVKGEVRDQRWKLQIPDAALKRSDGGDRIGKRCVRTGNGTSTPAQADNTLNDSDCRVKAGRRFHMEEWFDNRSAWTSYGHDGRGLNDPNREGATLRGAGTGSLAGNGLHMDGARMIGTLGPGCRRVGRRRQRNVSVSRSRSGGTSWTSRSGPEEALKKLRKGSDREGPHKGPQVMIRKPSDRAGSV